MGQIVDKINIAKVLEGIGVKKIITVDPLDLDASVKAVCECADMPGVKAVIFKSPCILQYLSLRQVQNSSKCIQ